MFKQNIKKYFNYDKWITLSVKKKENILKKLYNVAKTEIKNNSKEIIFMDNYFHNYLGGFNNETKDIYINKYYLTNNFTELISYDFYNLIYHELYHSYQNYLSSINDSLKINDILQKNEVFLINNKKSYLYINDYNNLDIKNKEKAKMYYILCHLEREAIYYSYNKTIEIKLEYPKLVEIYCENFNEIYGLSFTQTDIFNLIDTCYLNIYNHKSPSNDIEATIMYDICIFALYQGQSITEMEVMNYLNKENKQKILEDQEFSIYTNPFKASNSFIKKYDISSLSKEELKDIIMQMNYSQKTNNPIFLYKANKILKDNYKVNDNDIDTNINQGIEDEIEFEER